MEMKEAIGLLIESRDLTEDQAYGACLEIMDAKATPAQIASLLTGLRMKGETADELTGFTRAMRDRMIKVECNGNFLIDTCGTGGDGLGTFNISTCAAFIAAGAGCRIAKHGNRAISSMCGSADIISALGIEIEINKEEAERCLERLGICFLFAPLFHPAMKSAASPRKEMGIRTIFNMLGPLANPAGVKRQVIGVCKKEHISNMIKVLKNLGAEHALVVHGKDGIDEITTTSIAYVQEIKNGSVTEFEISPAEFGIPFARSEEIMGGKTEEIVSSIMKVLNAEPGPKTDIAVLNAAAGIYVAGKAPNIKEGIALARESVFSGSALRKLEESRRFRPDGHSK
jgi:anthranilate phosphoribosyltransferase